MERSDEGADGRLRLVASPSARGRGRGDVVQLAAAIGRLGHALDLLPQLVAGHLFVAHGG
eukprot:1190050-Prorocentrum_minimum.AAC.3